MEIDIRICWKITQDEARQIKARQSDTQTRKCPLFWQILPIASKINFARTLWKPQKQQIYKLSKTYLRSSLSVVKHILGQQTTVQHGLFVKCTGLLFHRPGARLIKT